jgi:hypothetical protein
MQETTVETVCCETDKLLQQYELQLKKPKKPACDTY